MPTLPDDPNPAPWSYRPGEFDDWGMVRDANGDTVALARGVYLDREDEVAHRAAGTDPFEEVGRKIVAIPALIAACEKIVEMLNGDPSYKACELAMAALALAIPPAPRPA